MAQLGSVFSTLGGLFCVEGAGRECSDVVFRQDGGVFGEGLGGVEGSEADYTIECGEGFEWVFADFGV